MEKRRSQSDLYFKCQMKILNKETFFKHKMK